MAIDNLKPRAQKATIYQQRPNYLAKAYLKTIKSEYLEQGYTRFIAVTAYVVKSNPVGRITRNKPQIGITLQMGNTNALHIYCQEVQPVIEALQFAINSLKDQAPTIQRKMDEQVQEFYKV